MTKNALLDISQIGNWLWQGGRIRVLQTIQANGGAVLSSGDILRLDRLVPYDIETTPRLCGMYFVSQADPSVKLYLSGWHTGDAARFELVIE